MSDQKPQHDNVVEVKTTAVIPRGKRKQLREQFPKLFGLRCWELADKKIKAGIALEEVGRWIQDDMLEYRDAKRDSLIRALYRYKGVLAELYPDEVAEIKPSVVDDLVAEMRRGVDELEELEKLYLLQLKRIGIDVKTETTINKLFKTTSVEMQTAMQILAKRMEIKQKCGLVATVPDRVDVNNRNLTVGVHVPAGAIEVPIDDEKRLKLGVVAEKLFSALTKASDAEIKQVVEEKQLN